jgi:hypothetical protein
MRAFVIALLFSTAAWGQTLIASSESVIPEFSSSRANVAAVLIEPGPAIIEAPKPSVKPAPDTRTWMLLSASSHSAAGFDAWTTRRNIRSGQVELNPVLKPFANSNAIYAATQVGPAVTDYVGWRMMRSRNRVVRRLWWVPQVASAAVSLTCGIKNASNY